MKKMLKVLCFSILTLGLSNVFADALSAKPLRVGPVQNYGALGTSGGKIISLASKKQVMLRGISLFWSDATGIQYYNPEVISYMALLINTGGYFENQSTLGLFYHVFLQKSIDWKK